MAGNPADAPKPIGVATLRAGGPLELRLRADETGGPAHGDALLLIVSSDARFREILKHVGGLQSGETKQVPPWPDWRPPATPRS